MCSTTDKYYDMLRFVDTVCEYNAEVYGEVNGERHLLGGYLITKNR